MNKKELQITILPEDAEKAGRYRDGHSCLLVTALKREFPDTLCIYALPHEVEIDNFSYKISQYIYLLINQAYGGTGYPNKKPYLEKAIEVTLTPA